MESPEIEFGTVLLCSEIWNLMFRVESGELPREKTLEELPSVIFVGLQTHDKSITPSSDRTECMESFGSGAANSLARVSGMAESVAGKWRISFDFCCPE